MIKYSRQDLSEQDISAVVDILRGDLITQGPAVGQFEIAVSKYVGAKHQGVAVNSATSGLHIAYLALDVGVGDIVWTSANTFLATASAALMCGASVDFVDICEQTLNICPVALRSKLRKAASMNRVPKVLTVVHFAGLSCDMKSISELATEFGFAIVEDASHALGASYNGKPVGACEFSEVCVFSFHAIKMITTGEGGMVFARDEGIANRLRRLRSHGVTSNPDEMFIGPDDELWNYQMLEVGFNYRLTDIQAALGTSQLERVDEFVSARNDIAIEYNRAFERAELKTQKVPLDCISSYHLFVIRVTERSRCSRRQLYDHLWDSGIAINFHYIPVYRHPFFEARGFTKGYCPIAETYFRDGISIPLHTQLTRPDFDHVVSSINAVV